MRDRMPKESGEEMKKEKEYGCGEGEVGGEEPMMMRRRDQVSGMDTTQKENKKPKQKQTT